MRQVFKRCVYRAANRRPVGKRSIPATCRRRSTGGGIVRISQSASPSDSGRAGQTLQVGSARAMTERSLRFLYCHGLGAGISEA